MRLCLDLEVGPLRITFDPFGQLDETDEAEEPEPEPEPAKSGDRWPLDSQAEYGATHRGPELQHGHRDPFYDEGGRWADKRRRTGFGPHPRA